MEKLKNYLFMKIETKFLYSFRLVEFTKFATDFDARIFKSFHVEIS